MQAGDSATANATTAAGAQAPFVVVGPCVELHKGGIAYFSSHLVSTLNKDRPVEFVTWNELYPRWLLSREVAPPESVATAHPGTPLLSYSSPQSWRKTAHAILSMTPAAIVFNWVHPVHAPIYAYLLRFFKGRSPAPRVVICHNVEPHERFLGDTQLVRLALRSASHLIVHSEAQERRARQLFPSLSIRRLTIPVFSVETGAAPAPVADALLYFGAVRDYKGIDLLIEALPAVRTAFPNCTLTIAGESFGRYGDRLDAQIRALGLEGIVKLDLRYVADSELDELFGRAAVVVLPFREVTQSASLSLAVASGRPVVTTDLPELRQVIAASDALWTAAPNDVQSLTTAIVAALESGQKRRTRAPDAAESWSSYAKALAEVQ